MADLEDHAVVHRLSRENESDFRFRKSFPPKVTRVVESVKHNGRPLPADSLDLKQNESLSEGDNCHEARTKRKRRRRAQRKSRRWRPYAELSWEEKKILEEKESLRASRIRAEMFAKGQPVAPYNTTQFLMEDHDLKEPDLKTGDSTPKRLAGRREDTSEDDFNEDGDGMSSDDLDTGEFLQRDFSETYERYHTESLEDMSKQELIKEYLELERCLSTKEEENRKLKLSEEQHQKASTEQRRVQELEREIERLKDENLRLTREREPLSMDKENIQINQNY
ncbi:protein HEXIM1-like [Ambystoma mexicanum]|uniref:protein HEXIM1-like n=1 Tax=Ambystoma mexicanum TaxID=8296 RepID=UPI0037E89001